MDSLGICDIIIYLIQHVTLRPPPSPCQGPPWRHPRRDLHCPPRPEEGQAVGPWR